MRILTIIALSILMALALSLGCRDMHGYHFWHGMGQRGNPSEQTAGDGQSQAPRATPPPPPDNGPAYSRKNPFAP
jgi:hypothetical protein